MWYSATKLEALALIECLRHFGYSLYGHEFCVSTDHKSLCYLLSSDRLNARLSRMALKLQHWLVTIKYLPGQENYLADTLSLQEWPDEEMDETVSSGAQSGEGVCKGPALTVEGGRGDAAGWMHDT